MAAKGLPEMPCGPILELHGQRKRFHVPYGLKQLLEDMTREVIRSQPENIYQFLAEFMAKRSEKKNVALEEAQEKRKSRKSWQIHRWSWEAKSILPKEDLDELLGSFSTPPEETEKHAVVIQSAFRGYQARKKVKEIRNSVQLQRLSIAAEVEEALEEGEDEMQDEMKDELKDAVEAELDALLDDENAEKHATVIQSAYRGFQARKQMKEMRSSTANLNTESAETLAEDPVKEEPEKVEEPADVEEPEKLEEPAPVEEPPKAEEVNEVSDAEEDAEG